MYKKDLIRLPLGTYHLTDGIYNYKLEKTLTSDDKSVMYSIREKQFGGHLCFFEYIDNVFENSSRYKQTMLSVCTSVGGISVHSKDSFSCLSGLEFVPQSSFLQFLTSKPNNQ